MPACARRLRPRLLAALVTSILATVLFSAGAATAQPRDDYPVRPVRLVVSYAPGNIADVLARLIAQRLSERWHQPVVVENRPGQGGSLGAGVVVKAAPDGYTLLLSAMAAIAINPHLYPKLGHDPVNDLTPITGVARTAGSILYVNNDLKVKDLPGLIAYSKAHPDTLTYGTAGSGTVPHLNFESLKSLTGLDVRHVPYKAAVAVLNDVIGGQIHMAQESSAVVLPQVKAGKVRPIAIGGTERLRELKDLPTVSEIVPKFEPLSAWMGILAPAGLPAERAERIHVAVSSVLRQPDIVERFAGIGLILLDQPAGPFRQMIVRDHERLGHQVRALKLQAD